MTISKEAKAAYDRAYRAANKAKIAEAKRANVLANAEREAARVKAWVEANRERSREIKKAWKERNPETDRIYFELNRDKVNATKAARRAVRPDIHRRHAAQRRAGVSHATPSWTDKAAVKEMYVRAKAAGLQVDHTIPLNGANVCGLHVHNNLQLLPARENRIKGNRYAG